MTIVEVLSDKTRFFQWLKRKSWPFDKFIILDEPFTLTREDVMADDWTSSAE